MTEELTELRQQIDALDTQLIALLAERISLVQQVGAVKSTVGLPIYDPHREAMMIKACRDKARAYGMSPQLIEDVLRRVMRESYASEKASGFKCLKPNLGNVVIIGGAGGLGQLFAQMFSSSHYQVISIDKNDWDKAPEAFAQAGLVIVSVPIDLTNEVIERLPKLPDECILCDFTSIKAEPMRAMLAKHQGPVIGLHPMFGPDISSFAKQVIVYCQGRMDEQCTWLLDQFVIWGASLKEISAQEHDSSMTYIQALRHFTTYVYGWYLSQENVDINNLLSLSSPIYRLELTMVGRLFAQDPKLYADIIFSGQDNQQTIDKFHRCFTNAMALFDSKDKAQFIHHFDEVSDWFGEYSEHFMQESQLLLRQACDIKR